MDHPYKVGTYWYIKFGLGSTKVKIIASSAGRVAFKSTFGIVSGIESVEEFEQCRIPIQTKKGWF